MAETTVIYCLDGNKYRQYKGSITAEVTNETSTTATITYTYKIQMKDAAQYGVRAQVWVNGASKVDKTGAITTASSSWKTVISGSGTVSITKTTSNQTIPVKLTASGATHDGYGAAAGSASVTVNVVVTAKPAPNTYTITFHSNGGYNSPGNATKTAGTTLELTAITPVRIGYRMLGWSTSASATTPTYKINGQYTTDASTTLYAVWEKIPDTFTVKDDGNISNVLVKQSSTISDFYYRT